MDGANAIILKRYDYREQDALVVVYSAHRGRLTLLARGAKKPQSKLAGHLEPLTLAEIMIIQGRGFDYIGSAVTRRAFPGIRADLNKLYYAGQAAAFYCRETQESIADQNLFRLFVSWLEALDDFSAGGGGELSKESGEALLAFLTVHFLAATGRGPQLYSCLDCRRPIRPGRNRFDLAGGGLICPACQTAGQRLRLDEGRLVLMSDNAVKLARYLLSGPSTAVRRLRAGGRETAEVLTIMRNFLRFGQ